LDLPVVPPDADWPQSPNLKTDLPVLPTIGDGQDVEPQWEIVADRINGHLRVNVRDGNETIVPDGIVLYTAEQLHMAASAEDPADVELRSHVVYRLQVDGVEVEVQAEGSIESTERDFDFDLKLSVRLDAELFFQQQWQERIGRYL
jgi:hypothetical protein